MTWNNIGVAATGLAEWEQAKPSFRKALEIDIQYPIPHANLAIVAAAQGEQEIASQELARAASLGYRGTSLDCTLQKAQSILARIESRWPSA
jgi:Flp pilus assembly protein TadD